MGVKDAEEVEVEEIEVEEIEEECACAPQPKAWYESTELWTFIVSLLAGLLQKYLDLDIIDPTLQAQLTALIIVLIRIFKTGQPTSLNLKMLRAQRARNAR